MKRSKGISIVLELKKDEAQVEKKRKIWLLEFQKDFMYILKDWKRNVVDGTWKCIQAPNLVAGNIKEF